MKNAKDFEDDVFKTEQGFIEQQHHNRDPKRKNMYLTNWNH